MDLALTVVASADNPVVHDLDLLGGQLHLVGELGDEREAVAQHVRQRLLFFLGEWFLNEAEGVPYYRDVLKKGASLPLIRGLLRRVIAETPGVSHVVELQLAHDRANRQLDVAWVAVTEEGERLLSSDYQPLVLEVA